MIKIVAIKPFMVEDIWAEVLPIMERVLEHNWGFYSMEDIKTELVAGTSLLVCVIDDGKYLACITCSEEPHPMKRVLHMPVVCGDRLDEWIDMCSESIPKIAKELGYDMLITKGRKGWVKKLKKYGYKELYVSCGLEL